MDNETPPETPEPPVQNGNGNGNGHAVERRDWLMFFVLILALVALSYFGYLDHVEQPANEPGVGQVRQILAMVVSTILGGYFALATVGKK